MAGAGEGALLYGRAAITTYTGRTVVLDDPRPKDVELADVAHALSNLCRFGGHVRRYYSVAEHSILVSYAVPKKMALQGLLHDAHEAYLGDIVSPLKRLLSTERERVGEPSLAYLAFKWDEAIGARLSVKLAPLPDEVKHADLAALYFEAECLFPGTIAAPPGMREDARQLFRRREVLCLPPEAAERLFIDRCLELAR